MLVISLVLPVALMGLAFLLWWMEESFLSIGERQDQLIKLINDSSPEELEAKVVELFDPVLSRRGA